MFVIARTSTPDATRKPQGRTVEALIRQAETHERDAERYRQGAFMLGAMAGSLGAAAKLMEAGSNVKAKTGALILTLAATGVAGLAATAAEAARRAEKQAAADRAAADKAAAEKAAAEKAAADNLATAKRAAEMAAKEAKEERIEGEIREMLGPDRSTRDYGGRESAFDRDRSDRISHTC